MNASKFQVVSSGVKLNDCFKLSQSVSIFVPSTIDANVKADQSFVDSVIRFVSIELSNKFGGGNSESKRQGFWVSDNLGLIIEDVTPVNASFDVLTPDNEQFIVDLANTVKLIMGQESVYFVINGQAYLV